MTSPLSLHEWLKTQPQVHAQFQDFMGQLKRRKIRGPDRCSRETLLLLKRMLGSCRWQHTQQMMDYIRAGKRCFVEETPALRSP